MLLGFRHLTFSFNFQLPTFISNFIFNFNTIVDLHREILSFKDTHFRVELVSMINTSGSGSKTPKVSLLRDHSKRNSC